MSPWQLNLSLELRLDVMGVGKRGVNSKSVSGPLDVVSD